LKNGDKKYPPIAGLSRKSPGKPEMADWMVADAVHCEPVSGQFRKQQGKKQAESKVSPVKGFRAGSKIQQTSMFFE
jgi:hypothetical protein